MKLWVVVVLAVCCAGIEVGTVGNAEEPLESMFTQAKPLQYKKPKIDCKDLPGGCETEGLVECKGEECEFKGISLPLRVVISLAGACAALGAIYVFMRATPLYAYLTSRPQLSSKAL